MNLFKEISIPKPIVFLLQLLAFLCHGCYSISAWVCLCHCVWPYVLVWILLRELMCVCRTCETHARFHQTCQSKNTMMIVIPGHTHTYIIYICNISMYLWDLISCNIQKDLKAGAKLRVYLRLMAALLQTQPAQRLGLVQCGAPVIDGTRATLLGPLVGPKDWNLNRHWRTTAWWSC